MGGGPISSLDVHWPHFIDSSLSSIGSGGFGYGNQIDDYSLAMAAPAAVWGTSRAHISPGFQLGGVAAGNIHGQYGSLFNMSSQLAMKPPQLSVGFGGAAGIGSLMNINNCSSSQVYTRPSPVATGSSVSGALGNIGTAVDVVAQLASGLGAGMLGGGNLVCMPPLLQPSQIATGYGTGLGGSGSGTSFAADMSSISLPGHGLQQPRSGMAQSAFFGVPGMAGTGNLFDTVFPMQPSRASPGLGLGERGVLGDDVLLGMSRPLPLPLQPSPLAAAAPSAAAVLEGGVASNGDLLNMSTSGPLQPVVAGAAGNGRFMDMCSRQFHLTSIPDLPDLSDLTDLPAISAMESQAYALKQEPAQNLTCALTGDVPFFDRTGIVGSDSIVAPPPLRFKDLNVASVPYDNRFRQAFATQLNPSHLPAPPLLSSSRGDSRDVGMPLFSHTQAAGGLPGGSLVLDGARSELINISKMTPQEILDAKALAASKNHSEAERRRRERINTHLGTLRTLLPSSTKTDKASLLGEVIEHVNGLKRQAADIEGPVPSEIDDLTVEKGEPYAEQPGKTVLKVTVSCDDRPGLLADLGRTLDRCNLDNFHMELATISGRINVVMLAYSRDDNTPEAGKHEAFMSNVQEALRSVVDKAGGTDNSSGSSGGGLKRQRTMSSSPS